MARKKKYCIDFRNMHTALHGLIVFNTRKDAEDSFSFLKENIRKIELGKMAENLSYEDILDIVFNNSCEYIEEIDFRRIKEKQLYGRLQKIYNDDFIIVNFVSIDLYL